MIHKVKVFSFNVHLFDGEYKAEDLIHTWKNSEAGKWVISNSYSPIQIDKLFDPSTFETKYCITAFFKPKDHVYWRLRYDN